MRKAIIGKWMGAEFVLMFALALALFGAGTASAQTNTTGWEFEPLTFSISANGSTTSVASVAAILGATDANNNTVAGNEDGTIQNTGTGKLIRSFPLAGGLGISSRPIMANIQSGDSLFMAAVIRNVSSAIVADIRNGVSGAAAQIISAVTATFPAELFRGHVGSQIVALSPSYATGIPVGIEIHPATSVVVVWEGLANLVTDATAANALLNGTGVRANVYISSGDTAAHIGNSNWVGAEIGTAKETGPILSSVNIVDATDTTAILAKTGILGLQSLPHPLPADFEFRASDWLQADLILNVNADKDGEPDVYFGADSDPLIVNTDTGVGTGSGNGTSVTVSSSVPSLSTTALLTSSDRLWVKPENSTGSSVIVNVSSTIDPNLVTFGPYVEFSVTLGVADDVGSVTSASAVKRVDSVAPAVTQFQTFAETALGSAAEKDKTSAAGATNRKKISSRSSALNQAKVLVDVFPGQETNTTTSWLSANLTTGSDSSRDWNAETAGGAFINLNAIPTASNDDVYGQFRITGVPAVPEGTVQGAQIEAWIDNDFPITEAHAFFIVCVSDNARNFALAGPVGGGTTASISSRSNFSALYQFGTAQATSRSVNAATVSVDNTPPWVKDATLSVIAMPSNYFTGINNLGTAGRELFGQLKQTTEVIDNFIGQKSISDFRAKGFIGANDNFTGNLLLSDPEVKSASYVFQVLRGTAGMDLAGNELDQSGSPIQVVVHFDPATDTGDATDESNDWDQVVPPDASSTLAYLTNAFRFDFASATIGYATDAVVGKNNKTWTAVSARAANAENFYVTFEQQSGIPSIGASNSDVRVNVSVTDLGLNWGPNSNTSGIIVDVERPSIDTWGNLNAADSGYDYDLVSGSLKDGQDATSIILISSKFASTNSSLGSLEASGFNRNASNAITFFANSGDANKAFLNSAGNIVSHSSSGSTVANATLVPNLTAGSMIIVSATFAEGGVANLFNTYGNRGAFPYLLMTNVQTDDSDYLDAGKRLWGDTFRTMAADFSDFIRSATAVLPDVSVNVTQSDNLGDPAPGDIISATWFFLVSNAATDLNGLISSSQVRSVTMIARDLSGNVVRRGIPVGTADFGAPSVSIVAYKISTPARAVLDATIQVTESEYNNASFAKASAFAISAATAVFDNDNKAASTLTVVAKADNGPFRSSNPFLANFSEFGGPSEKAPASTSTAGSVLYATFTYTLNNDPNTIPSSSSTADVIVTAFKQNGTFTNRDTTDIQIDTSSPVLNSDSSTPPGVSPIVELASSFGDNLTDSLVRLGQPVSVTATIQVDAYENNSNVLDNFMLRARVRQIDGTNVGGLFAPSGAPFRDPEDPSNWWTYTFSVNVPSFNGLANVVVDVTDMAANTTKNQLSASTMLLENDPPAFSARSMSARNDINYVSGGVGISKAFRPIVTSVTPNVVGDGDTVRVVVEFVPNDPVFGIQQDFLDPTIFTARANYTQINGATSVSPVAMSKTGPIITATFEQQVSSSVGNVTGAIVAVTVTDPAGLTAIGNNQAGPVNVDSTPPIVTQEVVFYSSTGQIITDLTNQTGVSAAVVVTATYSDELTHVFADGPGQMLAGVSGASEFITNVSQAVSIDFSAFHSADRVKIPNYVAISPVAGATSAMTLISGANVSNSSTVTQLRNSKDVVLTAYFGRNLANDNPGLRLAVNRTSSANASVIAYASDTVGNVGTSTSTPVLVDDAAPTMSNRVLDVASFAVPFSNYVPAISSGSKILRPTRVTTNTPMTVMLDIIDQPDPLTGGNGQINLTDFNADPRQFSFSGSTTATHISQNFNVGSGNSSNSTFPSINPANPLDPAFYGFPVNPSTLVPVAGSLEVASVTAVDVFGNTTTQTTPQLIEIDRKGPVFLGSSLHAFDSVESVHSLSRANADNTSGLVNAAPGQWVIFAASVVVDGTDVINDVDFVHFRNFNVDWNALFGNRVAAIESGFAVIPELASATRAVVFATSAVQFSSGAVTASAQSISASALDALGNQGRSTDDDATLTVAINAQGPRATELAITVNGRGRHNGFNLSQLGIGGNTVDAATATFEMAPGNVIIIEATITTFNGAAPSAVTADFSALYPAALKNSVDEVMPTTIGITENGIVYAKWEKILTMDPNRQGTTAIFGDIDNVTSTQNNTNGLFFTTNPTVATTGSLAAGDTVTSASMADIKGLPFIQLQNSATPNNMASVIITIADVLSPFNPENTLSPPFATDSREPQAFYTIAVVDRLLEPSVVDPFGFPSAPNKPSGTPNRVRRDDTLKVTVDILNPTIAGNGNDRFVDLPGGGEAFDLTDVFLLAGQPLEVTADLSMFNTSDSNALATEGGTVNSVTYDTIVEGQPTAIHATFMTTVGSDVGTSVSRSAVIREVTPTVVDDAGNRPRNSTFDTNLFRLTNLAVDNTPPSISGSLTVVNQNTGAIISGGATIAPGTVLGVTVTVTDLVDSPLDVVVNSNYGNAILFVEGFEAASVLPLYNRTRFTGLNSIEMPFIVTMPGSDEAFSRPAFRFIIRATDTVGNTAEVNSLDTFALDARPEVTVAGATDGAITVNAEDTSTLTANAQDVGGIVALEWLLPDGVSGVTFAPDPAEEADFMVIPSNPAATKTASLGVMITPSLAATPQSFLLIANATDISGSTDTDVITVNINQPALFAEVFDVTSTAVDALVTSATTGASTSGWNRAAGEDIRQVTIEEGTTALVDILATDLYGETVTFSASGTAIDLGGTLTTLTSGMAQFAFTPGFMAVSGDATSATFDVTIQTNDGSSIDPDITTVVFNVLARPAVPTLELVSVAVAGNPVSAIFGQTISVPEGSILQVVLSAEDAGGDTLDFTANSAPAGVGLQTSSSQADGILSATVTFSPDFEFSDLSAIGFNNPLDPFAINFAVANTGETTLGTLNVDVTNVSQSPIVNATATVDSQTQLLADNDIVTVNAGASVVVDISAVDPDGDLLFVPVVVVTKTNSAIETSTVTQGSGSRTNTLVTVTVPQTVCSQDAVTIIYGATDATNMGTTRTYTILTNAGAAAGGYDEIVVAQGGGGSTQVNIRNIEPNKSIADENGNPKNLGVTSIMRSFAGAGPGLIAQIGGGNGRATHLSMGDVSGDNQEDLVISYGPLTDSASNSPKFEPNFVVVRSPLTKLQLPVSPSFAAFPRTGTGAQVYTGGDIRTAVGNFTGTAPAQIVTAQGTGGNGVVRIYQYTGAEAPNGWRVIGQFNPLTTNLQNNNASGAMNVAAGDVDGDGLDELLVSQTYSATSGGFFVILDLAYNPDAVLPDLPVTIAKRTVAKAFMPLFALGLDTPLNLGLDLAVTDIDGNGTNEILAAAQGPGAATSGGGLNLIAVMRATTSDGQVTGITRVVGGIRNLYANDVNPSGVLNIAAGELDNCGANGSELVVGTGAITNVDGADVTYANPAPQSRYRVVKLSSSDGTVTGVVNVLGPTQGLDAFVGPFNPDSGEVDLAVGEVQ